MWSPFYHNPEFHHVTIPVSGFREFATRPNIVAMNDAGYCTAGPLRAPFRRIPDAMIEVARARGRARRELAERCRAEMNVGALAR